MSESKKNDIASTPDQLINAGISSSVELSDQELDGVSAGKDGVVQPTIPTKQKAQQKAADAIDGFIKG